MKKAIVLLVGALGLVACKEQPPAAHATTTTSGAAPHEGQVTIEEVRAVLLEKRPGESAMIQALDITNDDGIVTLRGEVPDDATRADLVNRVRAMPNVRDVHDELRVDPHQSMRHRRGRVGTTTTTGAPHDPQHQRGAVGERDPTHQGVSRTDTVRHAMMLSHPNDATVIRHLTIRDEGDGVIILGGVVPDEDTHRSVLKAAKEAPGVKSVRDELQVQKR